MDTVGDETYISTFLLAGVDKNQASKLKEKLLKLQSRFICFKKISIFSFITLVLGYCIVFKMAIFTKWLL